MTRSRIALAAVAVAVAVCATIVATGATARQAPPPAAQRIDLASALPSFARGYRLALTRAVIPAGGAFAPHRHPGMQVALIERGTLRFTVFRGSVKVYRGDADGSQKLVRTIAAGRSGPVEQGEWIVETPSVWHRGANAGARRVVILLATLLRADEDASIPVTP